MPEYEYVYDHWDKGEGETVHIPEDAIGVTVSQFGKMGVVRYLVPVEDA